MRSGSRQRGGHGLGWRAPTLVCVALSALGLAACGAGGGNGGAAQSGTARTPTVVQPVPPPQRPIWCPAWRPATRLSQPNRPAGADSFDTRVLLGKTERAAKTYTLNHGCSWRVVEIDGRPLAITADARPDRVDAAINHGRVTAVGVY